MVQKGVVWGDSGDSGSCRVAGGEGRAEEPSVPVEPLEAQKLQPMRMTLAVQ